jgi:hypothetical protein
MKYKLGDIESLRALSVKGVGSKFSSSMKMGPCKLNNTSSLSRKASTTNKFNHDLLYYSFVILMKISLTFVNID